MPKGSGEFRASSGASQQAPHDPPAACSSQLTSPPAVADAIRRNPKRPSPETHCVTEHGIPEPDAGNTETEKQPLNACRFESIFQAIDL